MSQTRAICDFYRITERGDGLADVYLSPGVVVPLRDDLTGRTDYGVRALAVRGVDPEDPQWREDGLEEHVRRHYADWVSSADDVEF